jgi:antitoxin (DNA-binding transcriptional repressor) of toxin-antitoxin stability system
MQIVGAYEAKTNLSALLKKVSQGEIITITRRGKPVAELSRPVSRNSSNVTEAIAAIRAHRGNFEKAFEGVNVKDLIEEGRR